MLIVMRPWLWPVRTLLPDGPSADVAVGLARNAKAKPFDGSSLLLRTGSPTSSNEYTRRRLEASMFAQRTLFSGSSRLGMVSLSRQAMQYGEESLARTIQLQTFSWV